MCKQKRESSSLAGSLAVQTYKVGQLRVRGAMLPAGRRKSSRWTLLLLAALLVARPGCGARILGVFPVPSVSHQVVYHPLMTELARRGHEVVVITTDPIPDPPPANYTQIDQSFLYTYKDENLDFAAAGENKLPRYDVTVALMKFGDWLCENMLRHEPVRKLISPESTQTFDLVFVEQYFTFCEYGFGHRFRAPMISILSMPPYGVGHDTVGNPTNPSYLPEIYTEYSDRMTFLERLDNLAYSLRFRHYVYSTAFPVQHAIAKRYFGPTLPSLEELHYSTSMLFICYEPSFHPPRPQVPAVVQLTGLHLAPPKPLPQDIQKFLDLAPEGAVYVSLGSNVRSDRLGPKNRLALLEAFAELRGYHVLWKWESDSLPGKPANVKIQKWLPQQDILRHPKVKLFIMQGGLQSLEEAIDSGVPVIGIPYISDQYHNMKRVEEKGIGVTINNNEVTKENVLDAVKRILHDQSFRDNIRQLKATINDQPQTSLERAVWWTEYVLRHKGAAHLRTAAVDMPWYQYLLLDVVAALLVSVLLAVLLLCRIAKFVCRKLLSLASRKVKKN